MQWQLLRREGAGIPLLMQYQKFAASFDSPGQLQLRATMVNADGLRRITDANLGPKS